NEAHASAIKFQRHALDTSSFSERIAQLEAENAQLASELAVLRANPAPSSPVATTPDTAASTAEFTLTLRRLSAKLSLTETALQEHVAALVQANALAAQHKHSADAAYALAARTRGREEEGLQRERALERAVEQAQTETQLSDRVVTEYAALVRTLEGRSPPPSAKSWVGSTGSNGDAGASASSVTLLDSLAASKGELAELAAAHASQITALEARVASLEHELGVAESRASAAQTLTGELGDALARSKFAAEQARVDDRSAAGMVERYMKFTQQTTSALHSTLSALRTRHAATLATLHAQIAALQQQLGATRGSEERLRGALDELGGELMRETVGRRREVALRVRMVGREERVVEGLRRGVRRWEEGEDIEEGTHDLRTQNLLKDVHAVLALLDDDAGGAGTEGRMVLLESAVEMLVGELEEEVARQREAQGAEIEDVRPEARPAMADEAHPSTEETAETLQSSPTPPAALPSSPPPPASPPPAMRIVVPPPDAVLRSADVVLHQPSPRAPPNDSLLYDDFDFGGDERRVETGEAVEVEDVEDVEVKDAEDADDTVPLQTTDTATAMEDDNATHTHVAPAAPPLHLQLQLQTEDTENAELREEDAPVPEADPLQPEERLDAEKAPSSVPVHTPLDASPAPPAKVPENDDAHPLLADLETASKRYDALQRAFRDCHLALQELRTALGPSSPTPAAPAKELHAAVERLHDYTEDARVELEIRVADEQVLARGFATILQLQPGSPPGADGDADVPAADTAATQQLDADTARQIERFVRGADPVQEGFRRKLEDVEHDIAVVKSVLYAPPAPPPLPLVAPTTPEEASSGWAAWIRGSRSGTPAPGSPAYAETPTFGSVMTSPRLRKTSSSVSLLGAVAGREGNPFAGLGLRVPMPSYAGGGGDADDVPVVKPRQRTISGVYMVGLGAAGARRPSGLGRPSKAKVEEDAGDVE
ncbi:hypothetical protein C8J57DRAFT_1076028, partial [Mycena rebaudengoi]